MMMTAITITKKAIPAFAPDDMPPESTRKNKNVKNKTLFFSICSLFNNMIQKKKRVHEIPEIRTFLIWSCNKLICNIVINIV